MRIDTTMSVRADDGVVDLRERLTNRAAVSPLHRDSERVSRRAMGLSEKRGVTGGAESDDADGRFSSEDNELRFFVDRSGACDDDCDDNNNEEEDSDADSNAPSRSISTTHKRSRSGNSTPTSQRRPGRPLLERQVSPPSVSSTPTREKRARFEQETDPTVLSRRQKQIEYGKNTLSYQRYTLAIPRHKRKRHHPRTPCKNIKMSRRRWDNMVKSWKIHVHMWDDDDALEKLRSRSAVSPMDTAFSPSSNSSNNGPPSSPGHNPPADQKQTLLSPSKRRRRLSAELKSAADADSCENSRQVEAQPHPPSSVDDGDDEHFSWADDVDDLVKLLD